jgi:hypothetical protein
MAENGIELDQDFLICMKSYISLIPLFFLCYINLFTRVCNRIIQRADTIDHCLTSISCLYEFNPVWLCRLELYFESINTTSPTFVANKPNNQSSTIDSFKTKCDNSRRY